MAHVESPSSPVDNIESAIHVLFQVHKPSGRQHDKTRGLLLVAAQPDWTSQRILRGSVTLALRDYYRSHALLLPPLPAIFVRMVIDCIPLRPPSDGWRENYTLWIRLLLAIFAEVLQVRAVIVPGTISNAGAMHIAPGTTSTSVLPTMGVAAVWKFSIPYGYVIIFNLCATFFVFYMILARLLVCISRPEATDPIG
ncbi:hypothetical protein PHYPSEUDO_013260 [Phytophthora pseudosyringae]|uniref:Uncharacterized protein n=1 Tax=Phytophthora pseudosyringae TaxID=221518 RepID=A0A8T1W5R6_9STRA|nr:hypothetical protein PHYPSEUDO_013260 [Phytophthora pseudosyringae]